jgi:hypothetical protein
MKRILRIVASVAIGVALGGPVSQVSPMARTVFSWTALPRPEKSFSTSAEPAVAKDTSAPSESKGETDKAPEGSIDMPPEWIAAQGIEVAPLSRVLTVPGTITPRAGQGGRHGH